MRLALRTAATLLAAATITAQPRPLRVIRVTPAGDANVMAQISVTFDKPITGSLDKVVNPSSIMRVEPPVSGKMEWRDPSTIRIVPTSPLKPGTRYTITVANNFRAMDGSALMTPFVFSFRAQGPALMAGIPVGPPASGRLELFAKADQQFQLVYSTPVNLDLLSSASYAEFASFCPGGQRFVRMRAISQRAIRNTDTWQLQNAGGWQRERSTDSLRRIVTLVPQSPLPLGCPGDLVSPVEVEREHLSAVTRWPFSTYGQLQGSELHCGNRSWCPTGPISIRFTTPVRGSEVLKHVKVSPAIAFNIRDTIREDTTWVLEAALTPRTLYSATIDSSIRDIFGQNPQPGAQLSFNTTGYGPAINHPFGNQVVERIGFGTLSVQHINVDTLITYIAPVPDSLEHQLLSRFGWGYDSSWLKLRPLATVRRFPVQATVDRASRTSVPVIGSAAPAGRAPTLYAVRTTRNGASPGSEFGGPMALLQVTDLGVHARIGAAEGAVWVTGVSDGMPRSGATVALYNSSGRQLATATTDARGIAQFANWAERPVSADDDPDLSWRGFEGYVKVQLGDDRAVASLNRWDPDLSPWRFGVNAAWDDDRYPLAGALFTERGIYRPGERVYIKAIVRDGPLGALRAPAQRDSIRFVFTDRDGGELRDTTKSLSPFGTADWSVAIPSGAAIGTYAAEAQVVRRGKWKAVWYTTYRVAEYRPPEFLVEMNAPNVVRFPGGEFSTRLSARYLFGAPMGRAAMTWTARITSLPSWATSVPGVDGWHIGVSVDWWLQERDNVRVVGGGVDTLDAAGETDISVKLPASENGRPATVTIETAVTDVNRQTVGTSSSTTVHPAAFYIAARAVGQNYFWTAGEAQRVEILAVRPDGEKMADVRVRGTIVRREWHQVRRVRDGIMQEVGEWVADTVARCEIVSAPEARNCNFTPPGGGIYIVTFTATDPKRREVKTSFQRWASGSDWVPWNDESKFKMDVIPDRARYAVGDTATVLFASPFADAEAWITVEREGIIEQRRMRFTSGSTTLKFPISEAFAPNAFISVVVARGRSAPPGPLDDPGRPTIRVGYAQLRVTPEVKRLSITLSPDKNEYRPADSARVRIALRDAQGIGRQGEVTLWAVDEGVLSLTGYKTPDPLDLIYRERGLGMRLTSNLTAVAPQVPEGEKGRREAGGGGGADAADVLRSRFQTTAFFLGSVVTDANGNATASAKLPDNLTTFRVMAVAVTAADRFGKGQTPLLVTRPLLARPALPRFVRPGDRFEAGAVINRRDGSTAQVQVTATATGVTLRGPALRSLTIEASRGSEVRFPFEALQGVGDSVSFRFDVSGGADRDAVLVKLPVKPDYHPVARTIAGTVQSAQEVEFLLPANIDPARSGLTMSIGSSPLATVRGIAGQMRIYPYLCTEQIVSTITPTIALYRAQRQTGTTLVSGDPQLEIARAVELIKRRQRSDGGIGYWSPTHWTSPWLSAYAGIILLDAREVGVAVDSTLLDRLAQYVSNDLRGNATAQSSVVADWYQGQPARLRDQVAAADFLSRYGRANIAAENELLRSAALLPTEDRARLAEVISRRGLTAAARQLMTPIWATVRVEGRTAVIPDTARTFWYFESGIRPLSRILIATLAIEPQNALVGPLVETLAQQGRAGPMSLMWNTQDYAFAINALSAFDRRVNQQGQRSLRVVHGSNVLFESAASGAGRDSTVSLSGLLTDVPSGKALRLSINPGAGTSLVYYYLTVNEVPTVAPVNPLDNGIKVDRWYETYPGGKAVTTVTEGDLVRVRLRVTVPTSRHFVVLDDALPAGLEAVDLSLRTASVLPGPGRDVSESAPVDASGRTPSDAPWRYGRWDSGWWSAFDHREIRDDRVLYSATVLWPGSYSATYVARATTPGTFRKPPAHAEEMYNPAVNGRSDGGTFIVKIRPRGR